VTWKLGYEPLEKESFDSLQEAQVLIEQ